MAASPSRLSSATGREAAPSFKGLGGAMEVEGSAARERRSTFEPSGAPSTPTLHLRPVHLTSAMVMATEGVAPLAVTVRTGTTHSCGLRPPCSYSLPAS